MQSIFDMLDVFTCVNKDEYLTIVKGHINGIGLFKLI